MRTLAFRREMDRRFKRDTYAQVPKSFSEIKKAMKRRGYYHSKVKGERHRVLNADFLWEVS